MTPTRLPAGGRTEGTGWDPSDALVPALFERVKRRCPDAVAVLAGDRQTTYRHLDRRAGALAHRLVGLGVGPETTVPIFVERSIDMVVGLLAVWKAGGAAVPLGREYPDRRLALVLADAANLVVLTQRDLRGQLPTGNAAVVLLDEQDSVGAEPAAVEDAPHRPRPENLAYVSYTSGSTGRPKGVCLEHRSLANVFQWYAESTPTGSRILQFAPFGFDVSLHELFAAIASGSQLHILASRTRFDPQELAGFLARHRITRAVLPPVVIQQLAEAPVGADDLACLSELISTGDSLRVTPAIADLLARLPGCELRNHYGATENQGGTLHAFRGPLADQLGPAPLGRPVRNVRMHVLGTGMRPASPGQVGEVYFGGVGNARGYLNLPAVTAERFVPDCLSDEPGARLYRTGDLARVGADGKLEFLGRTDHQVQVRGFRVEPAEVEKALESCPGVRGAAVVGRPDATGGQRLVAYVVCADEDSAVQSRLRDFLAERLPDYLLPQAYVVLDALPLTENGKVYRDALPPVDATRPRVRAQYVAPRTPAERELARIWSEVLELADVGVHDDFFDIGGDSIKALLVVSRARRASGLDITVRRLFDLPTIAQLARGGVPRQRDGAGPA